MPEQSQVTVSTALYKFTTVFGTEWTTISAGIIIILIPSVTLFLLLQKTDLCRCDPRRGEGLIHATRQPVRHILYLAGRLAWINICWWAMTLAGLIVTGVIPASVVAMQMMRRYLRGQSKISFSISFRNGKPNGPGA